MILAGFLVSPNFSRDDFRESEVYKRSFMKMHKRGNLVSSRKQRVIIFLIILPTSSRQMICENAEVVYRCRYRSCQPWTRNKCFKPTSFLTHKEIIKPAYVQYIQVLVESRVHGNRFVSPNLCGLKMHLKQYQRHVNLLVYLGSFSC